MIINITGPEIDDFRQVVFDTKLVAPNILPALHRALFRFATEQQGIAHDEHSIHRTCSILSETVPASKFNLSMGFTKTPKNISSGSVTSPAPAVA